VTAYVVTAVMMSAHFCLHGSLLQIVTSIIEWVMLRALHCDRACLGPVDRMPMGYEHAPDAELPLEGRGSASPGSPSGSSEFNDSWQSDDDYGDELEALLYPQDKPSRASRSRRRGGSNR